jgi:hypothetical protein
LNYFIKKQTPTHLYQLDLQGSYQIKNLMGVLNTIENLKQKGFLIEDEADL